jgi:UDP-3-O-[3-hydroxymyristoyl] glucosamine N-acyltransferase
MRLSEYFDDCEIVSDGVFSTLGYIDSTAPFTLAYCDTIQYVKRAILNLNISCIIVTPELTDAADDVPGIVSSDQPRSTFYRLHNVIGAKRMPTVLSSYGVGMDCRIHPSASISKKSRIGDRVTVAEHVVIKDEVEIGDDCFIDANAVIGVEGLLYYIDGDRVNAIRHAGGVRIGKSVKILSNAVIVRSVHENMLTTVGDRSIIGVATNIGHEAIIGNDCIISSNCVIARRTKLEERVILGPSVTIREHVHVGKNAHIRLGSTVIEDVKDGESISGDFAVHHLTNLKAYHKKKHNIKN